MTDSKKFHYSYVELIDALKNVGLKNGSIVLAHVSTGMLGLAPGCKTQDDYSKLVYDALRSVVGSDGTIIVPTYTYSYCRNQTYDLLNTPSTVGPFTEYVRKLPEVVRSADPIFSVAGIGPAMPELIANLPKTCFGEDSLNHRLVKSDAFICTIGLGLHYATFRHHIEEMANVPFRYKKLFQGSSVVDSKIDPSGLIEDEWIYSVPLLSKNGQADAQDLEKTLKQKGICKEVKIGRSSVCAILAKDYFEETIFELKKDNWLTAVGPAADPLELEEKRVVPQKFTVSLSADPKVSEIVNSIFLLPREHVSDGLTEALGILERFFPGKLHKFQTGYQKDHLIVPEKWVQKKVSIKSLDGKFCLSSEDRALKALPYSLSFSGQISANELLQHVFVPQKDFNQAVMKSLYRKREWGIALGAKEFKSLTDSSYLIDVGTDFSYGNLCLLESCVNLQCNDSKSEPLENVVCEIGQHVSLSELTLSLECLFKLKTEKEKATRIVFTSSIEWANLLDDNKYRKI